MIKNTHLSSHKVAVILVRFNETEFSRQIFKHTQILNLKKICPVAAELFHVD